MFKIVILTNYKVVLYCSINRFDFLIHFLKFVSFSWEEFMGFKQACGL